MDKILAIICFIMGLVMVALAFPEGNLALVVTAITSTIAILIFRKLIPTDEVFVTRVFLLALLARLAFGLLIHLFDLREFFGGDANTYDLLASKMSDVWLGYAGEDIYTARDQIRLKGIGWGMSYLLAVFYSITGRNIYAAQCFYGVIGASIAPLIYICSFRIFNNRRVSQVASILVAVYPAFIIWTGQLLKDGLIIFLLVLAMVVVLRLQKKFSYVDVIILIFSLFGIISLRFYIFYMVAIAVVGSFIVGYSNSPQSVFRRVVILMLLGISLTYLGVIRYASSEFEVYGSLERVQLSRQDLSSRAESGFGEDLDVSTTEGAIQAIPVGLTYLMLAPFPWQVTNFRQMISLPDMLIWWCSIPFLIGGIIYSIKNKLRESLGILIFSLMLSLAYSLFQGNVGTAYRQRAQIQVFLFIFVGVGWTLYLERIENKKAQREQQKKQIDQKIKENSISNYVAKNEK